MSKRSHTHTDSRGNKTRTDVERHRDGSVDIRRSKVHQGPLGSPGSSVTSTTHIDKNGNSRTSKPKKGWF